MSVSFPGSNTTPLLKETLRCFGAGRQRFFASCERLGGGGNDDDFGGSGGADSDL
jgi:hypothetical protein